MKYGGKELLYAEQIADALVNNSTFRTWVLMRTKFANLADDARLLNEEMKKQRSAVAQTWWRSHFTEKCRCFGCRGQETDLLAIFEGAEQKRFALHFEVKHPGDQFKVGGHQAEAYPVRAKCWTEKAPPNVLPHSDATVILLCSSDQLKKFSPHTDSFASVITFEEVERDFPTMWE